MMYNNRFGSVSAAGTNPRPLSRGQSPFRCNHLT